MDFHRFFYVFIALGDWGIPSLREHIEHAQDPVHINVGARQLRTAHTIKQYVEVLQVGRGMIG